MNKEAGRQMRGRDAEDSKAPTGPAGLELRIDGLQAELTRSVIGSAIAVQRSLGPGLLESAYEACLEHELQLAGHRVERQVSLGLNYPGLNIPLAFRMDMVVDEALVIELKVAESFTAEHEAQILSYLRFSGKPVALLLNFGVYPMGKKGIRRFVMQTHPYSVPSE